MVKVDKSAAILRQAIDQFNPTHIVSMVSGGKDSAASDQVARELGVKIDLVIHGNTRCGIPETSQFVRDTYGSIGDFIGAHGFSYRVLKATPFRKAISKHIRKGRRGVRILLLNGARKDESENRQKYLQTFRQDPASPGNVWVNLIHDWTQDDRDRYLDSRCTPINPVAKALCRSGECMCGTMQTKAERVEAAVLYPDWGRWLSELEREAVRLHGFGWGEPFPKPRDERQADLFQPMCKDCVARAA